MAESLPLLHVNFCSIQSSCCGALWDGTGRRPGDITGAGGDEPRRRSGAVWCAGGGNQETTGVMSDPGVSMTEAEAAAAAKAAVAAALARGNGGKSPDGVSCRVHVCFVLPTR